MRERSNLLAVSGANQADGRVLCAAEHCTSIFYTVIQLCLCTCLSKMDGFSFLT